MTARIEVRNTGCEVFSVEVTVSLLGHCLYDGKTVYAPLVATHLILCALKLYLGEHKGSLPGAWKEFQEQSVACVNGLQEYLDDGLDPSVVLLKPDAKS